MNRKLEFLNWLIKRFQYNYKNLKNLHKVERRYPTVTIQSNVEIVHRQNLFLGENVFIGKGALLDCGGHEYCNYGGKITIGDDSFIGPYSVLLGTGEIEIGRRCSVATGTKIVSQNLDVKQVVEDGSVMEIHPPPHLFKKITIGDEVLIGAGVIISMGVTIGRGSLIPVGAVIKKDVPPNSFVVPQYRTKVMHRDSPLLNI